MGSYSAFTGVGEHFKPGLGKSRGVVHLLDRIASSVSRHEDDEHLWFHCDLRYQYSVDCGRTKAMLSRLAGVPATKKERMRNIVCSNWGQPLGQPLTYDLSIVLTTVDRITAYPGLIPCLRRLLPPLLRTQTDLRPLRLRVSLEIHA